MSPRDLRIALDIITNIQIKEIQKEIDKMAKLMMRKENCNE
jgi:hypothetical protein